MKDIFNAEVVAMIIKITLFIWEDGDKPFVEIIIFGVRANFVDFEIIQKLGR